jgi:hypothetical protein
VGELPSRRATNESCFTATKSSFTVVDSRLAAPDRATGRRLWSWRAWRGRRKTATSSGGPQLP